jgi:hypothetical protein
MVWFDFLALATSASASARNSETDLLLRLMRA